MAEASERIPSLGELLAQELCESTIYPGSEEKAKANPTWWDTPATRFDPEADEDHDEPDGQQGVVVQPDVAPSDEDRTE